MNSPRTFPDATACRTRLVYGEVFRCLADDAGNCPHSVAFAHSFYCTYPEREKFCSMANRDVLAGIAITA